MMCVNVKATSGEKGQSVSASVAGAGGRVRGSFNLLIGMMWQPTDISHQYPSQLSFFPFSIVIVWRVSWNTCNRNIVRSNTFKSVVVGTLV